MINKFTQIVPFREQWKLAILILPYYKSLVQCHCFLSCICICKKISDFKLINEIPSKPQLMDANQIFVLLFELKIALCFNCYKCIPHFVSLADIGTLINEI